MPTTNIQPIDVSARATPAKNQNSPHTKITDIAPANK